MIQNHLNCYVKCVVQRVAATSTIRMGCFSLVWSLTKVFIVCAIITLIPNIPPHAEYKAYNVVKPKSLDADLLRRRPLDNAERIFDGQLTGPEAFALYNGAVYTGIHGGFVVQIDEGELRPVVKFGQACDDLTEEHICGRPLGMKFDAAGNLYVADAYYGIFKYNIQKDQKTLLVDASEEIEGKKSSLINDLAVAKDGSIYFTVTSTTFSLYDGIHAMLAPGDGRIIKYDPQSKKTSVLAEGLLTPNGIALSSNEDFLVFSESIAARVMKYELKGSKKGTVSVFAEGLPGAPDNIRFDGRDGFYVSLVIPADEYHPLVTVSLGPFPYIRKFLGRLLYILEFPFAQIDRIYPNYICRRAAHAIGHLSTTAFLSPDGATILHLDSQGQIRDALIGRDGSINHVSDMIVAGDYILLGSPYNNFIARVPRPDEPHNVRIKSVRYEEATEEEKRRDDLAARKIEREAQAKREEQAKAEASAKKAAAAKRAAEEAQLKREAEVAAQKAEEEAKARLAAVAAKARAAEEAKAKKAADEAARKAAEEAKARKAAEENLRRAAEEAKAKKLAEKAKAEKLAEEAKARKLADEAKARKTAEELRLKKAAEESAKKKSESESKTARSSERSGKN